MQDILSEIVAHKRADLEQQLAKRCSMAEALRQSRSGIIAEFKRKSPSKGWIHPDIEPEQVVPLYARYGACASSILTNEEYFGGDPSFIPRARRAIAEAASQTEAGASMPQATAFPLLRKEFIIAPYQVYEAKFLGADAILLIAADLSTDQYAESLQLAHRLNLEVLLEVHDASELSYLQAGVPDMLGVNNRSLGTFHTDVQHSFQIAAQMQQAVAALGIDPAQSPVLVSESGISNPDTVKALREVGFRGFLIGECFMKETNPGEALARFIQAVEA